MALNEPLSFQDISSNVWTDPYYAQVWVHFNPAARPLSRILEVVENYGGQSVKIEVHPSRQPSMEIARFYLTDQDVGHIVIGLIENLGLEARGWGPAAGS